MMVIYPVVETRKENKTALRKEANDNTQQPGHDQFRPFLLRNN